MAQTGYTPIQIYSSSTASQAPSAANLNNSTLGSELAINITDGKLFYKDNGGSVQVIAWKVTPTTAGGTGLTSYTAGDTLYYATGTTLSKLAIGSSGYYMSSSGTAPQWSAPAALTKTDDTNVTLTLGGSASTALLNAASLTLGWTGQLAVSRGGTGYGSYTAGDLLYASGATTLSKLSIGSSTTILTSSGSAPQWTAASSVSIGTATNIAGGAAGSVPYQTGAGATSLLAIGTAYQVLGVNAGATAPSWQPSATSVLTTQGDLLYASAANTLARLAKNTTATRYLANTGTTNNPQWDQVNLANGVTGTLTVSNGGTGQTTFTAGYVLYGNGTSGISTSSKLYFDGNNLGIQSSSPNRDLYILGANSNGPLIVYNNTSSTNSAISLGGTGTVNGVATGANAAASLMIVNKDSGSGRSINAAGTLNAIGTDYAEYMVKAGDFTIAKGDICGVDSNGKLTNVFDDAIAFVVKSTNPSYVGGDQWFTEQYVESPVLPENATEEEISQYQEAISIWQTNNLAWKARMEEARQKVDRIAFSGQVPVNVMGAIPGQYIVPINDNGSIKGAAISNPTFEQYQQSIGKVIAIESDGRAKIIVKIA